MALLVMVALVLPSGGNGQEVSFMAKNPTPLFTFRGGTKFSNVTKNIGNGYFPEDGKKNLYKIFVGQPLRLGEGVDWGFIFTWPNSICLLDIFRPDVISSQRQLAP